MNGSSIATERVQQQIGNLLDDVEAALAQRDDRSDVMEHPDLATGEFRDMKIHPSLEKGLRHRGILRA